MRSTVAAGPEATRTNGALVSLGSVRRWPISGTRARGDLSIAYREYGTGPFDVLFVPGFVSHVELSYEIQADRVLCDQISAFARYIIFDKRGTGLSDRTLGTRHRTRVNPTEPPTGIKLNLKSMQAWLFKLVEEWRTKAPIEQLLEEVAYEGTSGE